MKPLAILALLLGTALGATPLLTLPTLKTATGTEYSDVKVTEKLVDGVKIVHSAGVAKIPYTELSPEMRQALGGFNEKEAKVASTENDKRAKYSPMLWRPYHTMAMKLKSEGPRDEYLLHLKHTSELQRALLPIITEANLFTVNGWLKAARSGKLTKNTPRAVAVSAWGEPELITLLPEGERLNWGADNWVMIKNGLVSEYSSESKLP